MIIDPVILNARKPENDRHGLAMLERMNRRHQPLYDWGLSFAPLPSARRILDIGCGGGQNIVTMRRLVPEACIFGIDFSPASCEISSRLNEADIAAGTVQIRQGDAMSLPYADGSFDLVTAVETVYYWPDFHRGLTEACRVLQPGGTLLICNESRSREGNQEVAKALNMEFYDQPELEIQLRRAGFTHVRTHVHPNGNWICAAARR